jgi:hypothetical protein
VGESMSRSHYPDSSSVLWCLQNDFLKGIDPLNDEIDDDDMIDNDACMQE